MPVPNTCVQIAKQTVIRIMQASDLIKRKKKKKGKKKKKQKRKAAVVVEDEIVLSVK